MTETLPWVPDDVESLLARTAHYPGGRAHDQKAHGRGGRPREYPTAVVADSPDAMVELLDRAGVNFPEYPVWEKGASVEDYDLHRLAVAQGFDRPARVVEEADLLEAVASGEVEEGWRGLVEPAHLGAIQDGPYYASLGLNMNGTFVSAVPAPVGIPGVDEPGERRAKAAEGAAEYAIGDAWSEKVPMGHEGVVAHVGIEKSRIVPIEYVQQKWDELYPALTIAAEQAEKRGDAVAALRYQAAQQVFGNRGRLAIALGVDAVDLGGRSLGARREIVVLNRGALRTSKQTLTPSDIEDGHISGRHPRVPGTWRDQADERDARDTNPSIERALKRVEDGTLPTTKDVEDRIRKQAIDLGIAPAASAVVAHHPGGHDHDQSTHSGGRGKGPEGPMVLAEGEGGAGQFCYANQRLNDGTVHPMDDAQQKAATAKALADEMDPEVFREMPLWRNGVKLDSDALSGRLYFDSLNGGDLDTTQAQLIDRARRADLDPDLVIISHRYGDRPMIRDELSGALSDTAKRLGGRNVPLDEEGALLLADKMNGNDPIPAFPAQLMMPSKGPAPTVDDLVAYMGSHAEGFGSGVTVAPLTSNWPARLYAQDSIHQWAKSANNTSPRSLAIQKVAAERFGIVGQGQPWEYEDRLADEWLSKPGARRPVEEFVGAQYRLTQRMFADAGVTHVKAYRGWRVDELGPDSDPFGASTGLAGYPVLGDRTVPLRPLSSFSFSRGTAADFSQGSQTSLMVVATVPVSRVFATPRTGVGCRNEGEVVLLGPRVNGTVAATRTDAWRPELPDHSGAGTLANDPSPGLVAAVGKSLPIERIPATDENEDWIKTRTWDLPEFETAEQLDDFLDGDLRHFMTLPAARPMPELLRTKVERLLAGKQAHHPGGKDHDQATHGRAPRVAFPLRPMTRYDGNQTKPWSVRGSWNDQQVMAYVEAADGTKIGLSVHGLKSPSSIDNPTAQRLLSAAAAAYDANPLPRDRSRQMSMAVQVWMENDTIFEHGGADGIQGWVSPGREGTRVVNINDTILRDVHADPTRFVNPKGFFMPSGPQGTDMAAEHVQGYVVMHEYGHAHAMNWGDNRTGEWSDEQLTDPRRRNFADRMDRLSMATLPNVSGRRRGPVPGMSRYGQNNPHEAYAEAFTEYVGTGGKTRNPAARLYAEEFGWKGAAAAAAAAPAPPWVPADVDGLLARLAHHPGGHDHPQKLHAGGGGSGPIPEGLGARNRTDAELKRYAKELATMPDGFGEESYWLDQMQTSRSINKATAKGDYLVDLDTHGVPRRRAVDRATEIAAAPVVIRMSPQAMEGVLRDGRLKTQFETENSGGYYSPVTRAAEEATAMHVPPKSDPAARPIYGYVDAPQTNREGTGQYGPVKLVLTDEAAERSTMTFGDSLESAFTPLPVGAARRGDVTPEQVNEAGYLVRSMARNPEAPFYAYAEAQVWGGVKLSDIARVDIQAEVAWPLMVKLQKAGIPYQVVDMHGKVVPMTVPSASAVVAHTYTGSNTPDAEGRPVGGRTIVEPPGAAPASARVAHLGEDHDQGHHGRRYAWTKRERDELLGRANHPSTLRWAPSEVDRLLPRWTPDDVEQLLARTAHHPGGKDHDQTTHARGEHGGGESKLMRRVHDTGGFTARQRGRAMVEPVDGYVVAIGTDHSEEIGPEEWAANGRERLHAYRASKQPLLDSNPRYNLGAWKDSSGKVWLDVTEVVPDRDEAISLGRARNQIAIWDVKAKAEILTGGTGAAAHERHHTPHPAPGHRGEASGQRPGDAGAVRPGPVRGDRRAATWAPGDVDALLTRKAEARTAHHPGGRDHPQKDHAGGGGQVLTIPGEPGHEGTSGIPLWENLPKKDQDAALRKIEGMVTDADGKPMTAKEVEDRIVANETALWDEASSKQQDWYFEFHGKLQDVADAHGFTVGQTAGAMAALSAKEDADQNVGEVEAVARTLRSNRTVELTQENIDAFNGWATARKAGAIQPLPGLKPGTYLVMPEAGADMPVCPAGILVSHQGLGGGKGIPGKKNADMAYNAVLIMRGEKTPDEVVKGPKQRSFVNNLVDPEGPLDVTHDTWDYRAKMKGMRITREVTVHEPGYDRAGKLMHDQSGEVIWVAKKGADGKPVKETVNLTVEEFEHPRYGVTPQNIFQPGSTKPRKTDGRVNYGLYPWLTKVDRRVAADLSKRPGGKTVVASQVQAAVWGRAKDVAPPRSAPFAPPTGVPNVD